MIEIIKVGLLGIVGVLIAIQFKAQKPEYAMYIGFSIGILIFCYSVRQFQTILSQFDIIKKYLGGGEGYLGIFMNVIGIT